MIETLNPGETTETSKAAAETMTSTQRNTFATALTGAIVAAAAGATVLSAGRAARAQTALTDADILNFALNLEYLEAEFYTLATTGTTIDQQGIGITGVGTQGDVIAKTNPQVSFSTTVLQQFANEIAADERAHVAFLRSALGSAAVARPQIDLLNSFNAAATAAGIGSSFDPFASESNFLIGAFAFEDVGVTAYKGAARYIQNKTYLAAAAGILGAEAYHAGGIRTRVYRAGATAIQLAQQISDARDSLDGSADDDQGVTGNNTGGYTGSGTANIVPTDTNALAFSRTTAQVLNIVYLNAATGVTSGGFFPNGVNGAIRST